MYILLNLAKNPWKTEIQLFLAVRYFTWKLELVSNISWINVGTTFQVKLTILIIFGQVWPKIVFPVKNEKSEHYHRILHIQISLALIQISISVYTDSLNFFSTKFSKKGYFRSKTEKSHLYVRPWSLLTILNFSARRPTNAMVF